MFPPKVPCFNDYDRSPPPPLALERLDFTRVDYVRGDLGESDDVADDVFDLVGERSLDASSTVPELRQLASANLLGKPALQKSISSVSQRSANSNKTEGSSGWSLKSSDRSRGRTTAFRRSNSSPSAGSSGRNTPLSGVPADDHRPKLWRSTSAQSALSKGSKTSAPHWAKPVLLRSSTVASSVSASSVPGDLWLTGLRAKNTVRVTYDLPCCQNYEFKEEFGKGGFGQVWKCQHKHTLEFFAIKRIAAKEQRDVDRLLRELKTFERLSHPHIVTLHEVFLDQEYLYMVMDLCTGGDLHSFLATFKDEPDRLLRKLEFPEHVVGLPPGLVGSFMWQMLLGIAYMHHNRICHRDVKMQNFVLKDQRQNPQLQLVDFGMAIRYRKGVLIKGTVGTVKYMAPEVLSGSYSEKIDIWSIGVVSYILSTERSPWGPRKSPQQICQCILQDLREPWPICDKPKVLRSLIDVLMRRDVRHRPSAKKLLKESVWLKNHCDKPFPSMRHCCVIS